MEIVQRILELVNEKAKSKRDFALMIGIPERTISTYLKIGRTPSLEVIDAILRTFPKISAEWLLRGKGNMYNEESSSDDGYPMIIKGDSGLTVFGMPIEDFFNEIVLNSRSFRDQLKLANERIQILKNEVERLQKTREERREPA